MNTIIKNSILYITVFLFFIHCKNKTKDKEVTNNSSINIDSLLAQNNDSLLFLSKVQFKNLDIKFGKLEKIQIAKELQLNGQINVKFNHLFQISLPLGGYVKEIYVKHGTKVKKGDSLLLVENIEFINIQEKYLIAKVHQKELDQELARKNELKKSNAISDKDYQKFESDYNQNKILLKSLYEQLLLINIIPEKLTNDNISRNIIFKSPGDGFVTNIKPLVGKYFIATDELLTIKNFQDMHLHLKAFEKDLESLRPGQKVWAYTNAEPDRKFLATIKVINISFDMDKTVEVHCEFDHTLPIHLIPGLYMSGLVQINPIYTYCLPEEAILQYQNKKYVFVEDINNPKHFDFIEVNTGIEDNTNVQIKDYQKLLNRKVVIKGSYYLLMQLKNTIDEE